LARFDPVLYQWSLDWHTQLGDKVVFAITQLGDLSSMLLFSLILTVIMYRWQMRRQIAFYWTGMLGAAVLFGGIKELVARVRPSSVIGDLHQHGYSFPSGHSTMSVAWALMLFLVFYPHLSERFRRAFVVFCLLFAAAVPLSRIYLGVHYLSDVAGGAVLAVFWVMLAAWFFGGYPFTTPQKLSPPQ
jgi:undecaprenyl-diphosphatase